MLRITTQDDPPVRVLRLEGRLEGPWVDVLTDCWRGVPTVPTGTRLHVDLDGVTFIDAAGMARLVEMHEQGAGFIANGLMAKWIVAEIADGLRAQRRNRKGTAGTKTAGSVPTSDVGRT